MKLFPLPRSGRGKWTKLEDDLATPQQLQQTTQWKSSSSSFSMHSRTSTNTTTDSDSSIDSMNEQQLQKQEQKQEQDGILLTSMVDNKDDKDKEDTVDQPTPSSTTTMKEAEKYWHRHVIPKLSPDQRDLVAEQLFCRLWMKEKDGNTTVLLQDISFWSSPSTSSSSSSLPFSAKERFAYGCELWGEEKYTEAMWEFERSREIRETELQQSLLFVRRQVQRKEGDDDTKDHVGNTDDTNDKDDVDEDTETRAQLFYAMGTVQMSLGDYAAALLEFRRALQISGIGLGIDDYLTQACMYMLKRVLLVLGGHTSPAIKSYIRDMTTDIEKEADADMHYKMGNLEDAFEEYANLSFVKDEDPQTQGRVQTKMALILEEKGEYVNAQELWADIMSLYTLSPSIGSTHPMTTMTMLKYVQCRVTMQEQV